MASPGDVRVAARAFNDYVAPPATRRRQVVGGLLAVVVGVGLWEMRGAVVGILALLVYGGVFLAPAFNLDTGAARRRGQIALDAALIAPLTFLALAYVTHLPLAGCIAAGLAAGAVFVPLALWRGAPKRPPGDLAGSRTE